MGSYSEYRENVGVDKSFLRSASVRRHFWAREAAAAEELRVSLGMICCFCWIYC